MPFRNTITYLYLISAVLFINKAFAKPKSDYIYYRCEGVRLQNGESLGYLPNLNIKFNGHKAFTEFYLNSYKNDQLICKQQLLKDIWQIECKDNVPIKIEVQKILNQLNSFSNTLSKRLEVNYISKFKKVLFFNLKPLTGEVYVGLGFDHVNNDDDSLKTYFRFFKRGQKEKTKKKSVLSSIEMWNEDLFIIKNKYTGMANLIRKTIKSAFIANQLTCLKDIKKVLKKKVEIKKIKPNYISPNNDFLFEDKTYHQVFFDASLRSSLIETIFLALAKKDNLIGDKELSIIQNEINKSQLFIKYKDISFHDKRDFDTSSRILSSHIKMAINSIDRSLLKNISQKKIKRSLEVTHLAILRFLQSS